MLVIINMLKRAVSLKHLRNLWGTLKMSVIYCETNLLTFSENCLISAVARAKYETLCYSSISVNSR